MSRQHKMGDSARQVTEGSADGQAAMGSANGQSATGRAQLLVVSLVAALAIVLAPASAPSSAMAQSGSAPTLASGANPAVAPSAAFLGVALGAPSQGAAPGAASQGAASGSPSLGFSDVKASDWFRPYLAELVAKQLVRGNADGTYAPDKLLFVDEFLAMALRTLGRDQGNAPGYWAKNYIDEAMRAGLVEPGEYAEYDVPITREQIARVAAQALGDEEFGDYRSGEGIFSDLAGAQDKESVLKAMDRGILAGYPDGTFRPQANATRAEAAAMVVRMVDKSYRLERYGDVFFNARTDLNETGNMNKGKVYDFVMALVKTMRIEPDADGKVVLSGVVPELPTGQVFVCHIMLMDKKGTILGFGSTTSEIEGEVIQHPGSYELTTAANAKDVSMINITFTIPIGESNRSLHGSTASFHINKDYDRPQYDFFFRNDGNRSFDFDFSLTSHIWGW